MRTLRAARSSWASCASFLPPSRHRPFVLSAACAARGVRYDTRRLHQLVQVRVVLLSRTGTLWVSFKFYGYGALPAQRFQTAPSRGVRHTRSYKVLMRKSSSAEPSRPSHPDLQILPASIALISVCALRVLPCASMSDVRASGRAGEHTNQVESMTFRILANFVVSATCAVPERKHFSSPVYECMGRAFAPTPAIALRDPRSRCSPWRPPRDTVACFLTHGHQCCNGAGR